MKFLRLGILIVVFGAICLLFAAKANAASFNINTTDDGNDANPGDSVCEVNVGQADCGLRALIEETNALGGTNSGIFDISGASVHTFTPATPYPGITNSLTLDAIAAQDGAQCNTLVPGSLPSANTPHSLMIEIDGTNATVGFGQGVIMFSNTAASSSVVRGLVINKTPGSAIHMSVAAVNNVTIECNYIGTNPGGTAASANGVGISGDNDNNLTIQNNLLSGNTNNAITLSGSNTVNINHNLIGTNSAGTASVPNNGGSNGAVSTTSANSVVFTNNIVSGNTSVGFKAANSSQTVITGNYAGLGTTGGTLGNGGDGLSLFGSNNSTIGGTSSAARNVSSANGGSGLHIYNNCDFGGANISTTYGNYFGTNISGTVQSGYGNQGAGVEVNEYYGGCVSVYKHVIGGDGAGQSNIIAGNTGQGLLIHQSGNEDVFSIASIANSVYANGQFGIDLAADSDSNSGVADTDLGPNAINNFLMSYPTTNANYYINRPTINSTSYSGNQVTVNYDYQANGVQDSVPEIQASNVVGFRLDFYINPGAQDGAYAGYAQGKTHLGSFIINNASVTNATHTFTSPIPVTGNENITVTATVLWQIIPDPGTNCQGDIWGDGPPYQETCIQ